MGCLTAQSSFYTSQGGCGMSYFPVIFLYITGWVCDVLLPSHHSLHHRVDVGYLTSLTFSVSQGRCGMSYFPGLIPCTGWMWDVLLTRPHSLHRMDVGCLTYQASFPAQGGCRMSYFPAIILYIKGWRSHIFLANQYFLCQSRMALFFTNVIFYVTDPSHHYFPTKLWEDNVLSYICLSNFFTI